MLHIRCGHDIQPTLVDAGITGEFLAWVDPLAQGPTPAHVEGDAWYDVRARFIANAYGEPSDEVRRQLTSMDRRLAGFRDFRDVVLWFEHDLFDQVILARLLAWFSTRDLGSTRLSLVTLSAHPTGERFFGLGNLGPEQLRAIFPSRIPVTIEMLMAGARTWAAYRQPEPLALDAIVKEPNLALPFAAAAMRRHLQELPWVRDGLSLTERLALGALASGPMTASATFGSVQEVEEAPWMGDIMFYHMVATLAAEPMPLLSSRLPWPEAKDAFGESELRLTPEGENVLAMRRDAIQSRGIQRWVGGTELSGAGATWRWDGQELRPVWR
jgi:hypothetical protein